MTDTKQPIRIPKEEVEQKNLLRDFSRFKSEQNNQFVLSQIKGYLASLDVLLDTEVDRKTAEKIHQGVMGIAHKISRKYNFSLTRETR